MLSAALFAHGNSRSGDFLVFRWRAGFLLAPVRPLFVSRAFSC